MSQNYAHLPNLYNCLSKFSFCTFPLNSPFCKACSFKTKCTNNSHKNYAQCVTRILIIFVLINVAGATTTNDSSFFSSFRSLADYQFNSLILFSVSILRTELLLFYTSIFTIQTLAICQLYQVLFILFVSMINSL